MKALGQVHQSKNVESFLTCLVLPHIYNITILSVMGGFKCLYTDSTSIIGPITTITKYNIILYYIILYTILSGSGCDVSSVVAQMTYAVPVINNHGGL